MCRANGERFFVPFERFQPRSMIGFLIVSCEHGGNRIPPPYRGLFRAEQEQALLKSHRGFDAGALAFSKDLAEQLAAPLVMSTVSRLLVDLNRSLGNPAVYSPNVRDAPTEVRRRIVDDYYSPYRSKLENLVRQGVGRNGPVIHISCHSFTPELKGEVRNADIGLLYDPARTGETDLCKRWQTSLKTCSPEFKVRRNYPYAGKNDGFTTYLRRCFSPDDYIGVELEINQKHVSRRGLVLAGLSNALIQSLILAISG